MFLGSIFSGVCSSPRAFIPKISLCSQAAYEDTEDSTSLCLWCAVFSVCSLPKSYRCISLFILHTSFLAGLCHNPPLFIGKTGSVAEAQFKPKQCGFRPHGAIILCSCFSRAIRPRVLSTEQARPAEPRGSQNLPLVWAPTDGMGTSWFLGGQGDSKKGTHFHG
jgi:hypothetical protein